MDNGRLVAVTLTSRADAETVREALLKLAKEQGGVTQADYFNLVGVTPTFEDEKVGWVGLTDVEIGEVSEDEFVLDLPMPTPVKVQ